MFNYNILKKGVFKLQSIKKIALFISIFTFLTYLGFEGLEVSAEDSGTKDQSNHTIILENPNDTQKVVDILEAEYPGMKIKGVDEIGLVFLNTSENKGIKQKEIDNKISQYIDSSGELPKISIGDPKPSTTSVDKSNTTPDNIPKLRSAAPTSTPLDSSDFNAFNWYLRDVTNDFKTYSINKGNESINVALIDSGIDTFHPLLKDNIDLNSAQSYINDEENMDEEDMRDDIGHGTQIAGILTSIAPNTTVVPYKVLGEKDGESLWVIEAIIDAAKNNSDVINVSVGTYKNVNKDERLLIKAYEKAVEFANDSGSLVVGSAGNDSHNLDDLKEEQKIHLPGGLPTVTTVSSSVKNDELAPYSNFGGEVDFSAPGGYFGPNFDENEEVDVTELLITTFPTSLSNSPIDQAIGIPQGYTLSYGTSLSAPQVSATAALIISEYEKKKEESPSADQILEYLNNGAIDLGPSGKDIKFGTGKVNAYNSLLLFDEDEDDIGSMQNMVERFKEKGDLSDQRVARSLNVHLTAVKHFEKTGQTEKVLKHLKGFQKLLDFKHDDELISDNAYDALKQDTAYLIEKRRS